jgi:NTP pyrophosphatase (non-canonical NTP hydrolase)
MGSDDMDEMDDGMTPGQRRRAAFDMAEADGLPLPQEQAREIAALRAQLAAARERAERAEEYGRMISDVSIRERHEFLAQINEQRALAERAEGLSLADLRAANETRQREWDRDERITLVYRANELAGEVGEACNVAKKLERERMGIRGSRDTVAHLAELADVVICCDLLAMHEGIDLGAAVVAKFNATSEKNGLATRLRAFLAREGRTP